MITDRMLAEAVRRSYQKATHRAGNAAFRVERKSGTMVIAMPGTDDFIDGVMDLWVVPWRPCQLEAWVHRGFWIYTKKLIPRIMDVMRLRPSPTLHLCGHSLGGAAAIITAGVLYKNGIEVASLTTFGAPPTGGAGLAALVKNIPGKRYITKNDPVAGALIDWLLPTFDYDRPANVLRDMPGFDHFIDSYIAALDLEESK
jgi:pimeloyl-ACP methyl ester carboxylesterase